MLLCQGPLVRVSPKNSGMEPHPPPEVLALGPAAIRLDFLLPFKEAAGASGGVSAAAFQIAHMEPIACRSGEHLPAWQGGG